MCLILISAAWFTLPFITLSSVTFQNLLPLFIITHNNDLHPEKCMSCVCAFRQACEENGEQMAFYSVAVSRLEGEDSENSSWCVTRKLSEFQALHRKLTEVPALTWGHMIT